ncbi:hypothetical protein PLEOSDRAFT_1072928 [Pleurotus ostreatus PC15]|uniref:Uncharacterized protein n=1 Tax=Pleurotus ostreatus (strain PC15) TaxID=1137138 RepID=A0A067N3K0_PLEO1|nr:hypothetical protein PLEOSDRAFT_1072928 [Pleurotus ostreatus PC15]
MADPNHLPVINAVFDAVNQAAQTSRPPENSRTFTVLAPGFTAKFERDADKWEIYS